MGRLLEFSKGTIMWMAVASSSCAPTPQDAPEHPGFFSRVQQAVQLAFVDVDPNDTNYSFHNVVYPQNSTYQYWGVLIIPQAAGGGNCGVTFISKHYAITAAHCVPEGTDSFNYYPQGAFIVKHINAAAVSPSTVVDASIVSGSYAGPGVKPNWTIPYPLSYSNGYLTEGMFCQLAWRCSTDWGTDRRCPPIANTHADIALIYCEDRAATLYLPARSDDPTSGDIGVYWFHEVLSLMTNSTDPYHQPPTNNWPNYGNLDSTSSIDNFHYTNSDNAGFLLLQSIHWADNTNYRITGRDDNYLNMGERITWTDMPGCHGTSGSGVIAAGASAQLGPMLYPNASVMNGLCYDAASIASTKKGTNLMSYLDAPYTYAMQQDQTALDYPINPNTGSPIPTILGDR